MTGSTKGIIWGCQLAIQMLLLGLVIAVIVGVCRDPMRIDPANLNARLIRRAGVVRMETPSDSWADHIARMVRDGPGAWPFLAATQEPYFPPNAKRLFPVATPMS